LGRGGLKVSFKWKKWLAVSVLLAIAFVFVQLLREQMGLDAWHKAWRNQKRLPAVSLPWESFDPNAIELRVNAAILGMKAGQALDASAVDQDLHRLKSLRPGWPYYLLLAQQWQLANGHLDTAEWINVLQKGVNEAPVAYAAAAVLFQNWERFSLPQRRRMLSLLWRSGARHQPRLINYAFLSSRLFDYCDYGYNTALDVPPDCRKAGWTPLTKPPQVRRRLPIGPD